MKKIDVFALWSQSILFIISSCTCQDRAQTIQIDGSSTVYVISEAIAEEYNKETKSKISIAMSGTGGGFKKLCSGRIEIIGASRKIKESEKKMCAEHNIEWLEIPVAYDGIILAINPRNTWVLSFSTSQLKKIFEPKAERKIITWKDVDDNWPDREMQIFAPGISSGTYDYFTEVIIGKEHESRGDLTSSEDDNVLVHGVSSNIDGLAFFSYAYFLENQDKLKAVPIIDDNSSHKEAITPNMQTIQSKKYNPLSRQVYIYVAKNIKGNNARAFLSFYVNNSSKIALEVGFIPLDEESLSQSLKQIEALNELK